MEEISENVYIEQDFPRVVLGALKLDHGLILVDSPFQTEHAQAWKAKIGQLGTGINILHFLLDAHIDRTLAAHAMETDMIVHENGEGIIRNRSGSSRCQELEIGPDWAHTELPSGARFFIPRMTFSDDVLIHWGEDPIAVSHKSGSHFAGAWLIYDAGKVVFIGDSVVVDQPPFLAKSDIEIWIDDLNWLLSDRFENFMIVSSRNGIIQPESVRKMSALLIEIKRLLDDLSTEEMPLLRVPELAIQIMNKINFDPQKEDRYQQRLRRGLEIYIKEHYTSQNVDIKGDHE